MTGTRRFATGLLIAAPRRGGKLRLVPQAADRSEAVTGLLRAWRQGDVAARDELLERV